MAERLSIRAMGMACSLGTSAMGACSAAHAGISRAGVLEESEAFDDESVSMVPLHGHEVPEVTQGFTDWARLIRLAEAALNDLTSNKAWTSHPISATAFIVLVSAGYFDNHTLAAELAEIADELEQPPEQVVAGAEAARRSRFVEGFGPAVARYCGMRFSSHHVFFHEHNGAIAALDLAAELLSTGKVQRVVVGGVDSLCDPSILPMLQTLGLLKTPNMAAGFMPGEAACFLLLEAGSDHPAHTFANIGLCFRSVDETSRFGEKRPTGKAVASALHACLDSTSQGIGLIASPFNGEAWAAEEWGQAQMYLDRLRTHGAQPRLRYPAESFGETGAAAPFAALCIGAHEIWRGRTLSSVVTLVASPEGARGAILLHPPAQGTPS